MVSKMGLYLKSSSKLLITQLMAVVTLSFMGYMGARFLLNFNYAGLSMYYFYNTNLLSWGLFYTGVLSGFLVFIFSDVKVFFNKIFNHLALLIFILSVWIFVNESNPLNLFLTYELFLLPSFLLVYSLSPNSSAVLASIYFLTWTQFGSLLVLIALMGLFTQTGYIEFSSADIAHTSKFYWLLFLGFGIKMPMWPFYYWLTKTHVEASSFFSMYLSGFLVKTAVFLFMKFYGVLGSSFAAPVLLIIFCIGVIDSSMKMWHQTDLKKLMAYTTVQEMNFLCIPMLWNDTFGESLVALFMATHCLLSCIFFFFIDVVSKRLGTSASSQVTGLVHTMPYFSLLVFISWVLFAGLPFTVKFLLEVGIFSLLYIQNFIMASSVLIIMNVLGLIGFTKNLFNALFGAPVMTDFVVYDLTKREAFLFIFFLMNLILLNSFSMMMF